MKCAGTQLFSITRFGFADAYYAVIVDGRHLTDDEVETLAHNDGFDSLQDFLSWFDRDYQGKIIHWTDLRY